MQHQFEHRKSFSNPSSNPKEGLYGNIPSLSYETWFKLFGLLSSGLDHERRYGPIKQDRTPVKIKRLYCQLVTAMLWFFAVRGFVLMFIEDKGLAVLMGDLSVYWNDYRMYYLMPTFYYSFSSALVATTFLVKERDLSWFIPFMTFSQHQSTADPNEKIGFHRWRTLIFTLFNLMVTFWVSGAMGYLTYSSARDNMDEHTFRLFIPWLVVQIVWYFFMTGILMFTTSYFNLVCLMVQKKFSDVAAEIETLAEGDPGPPGSKNDDLTRLYFAHNDLCEITDESNSFWQYILFYVIGNFIPNFCYAMYTLFFGDLDTPLAIFSWFILGHTFLIMAILSVSAADVSSEAHAPYTSLHTLSLLQLPIDIEVNMSTFLHRVRGPTIGYSILDLFVITNSSISNTVAAIASYFLIVADFSRSTVNQGLIQKAQSKQRAINESLALATTSSVLDATTIASTG